MINTSVLEDNSKRVGKRCIWIAVIGLLIVIGVCAIFIALYFNGTGSYDTIKTELDTAKNNNTALSTNAATLTQSYNAKLAINQAWNTNITTETARYNTLAATNQTVGAELAALQDELYAIQLQFGFCTAASVISLGLNIWLIPTIISTYSTLQTLTANEIYLYNRYTQLLPNMLQHYIMVKEKTSWPKLRLLYNSTLSGFTKATFTSYVSGQVNTATLLRTTGEEVMAYVMAKAWDFTYDVTDAASYTYSFRQSSQTSKSATGVSTTNNGFIQIGTPEILLNTDATGTAVAGKGFTASTTDTTNFYVSGGSFTLDSLQTFRYY